MAWSSSGLWRRCMVARSVCFSLPCLMQLLQSTMSRPLLSRTQCKAALLVAGGSWSELLCPDTAVHRLPQDGTLVRVAALACIGGLLVTSLASLLQRNSGSQAGVQLNEDVRQALVPPGESPREA